MINSLLPYIGELRRIAKLTNAAVIRFSELKLDNSFLHQKLKLMGRASCLVRWGMSEMSVIS